MSTRQMLGLGIASTAFLLATIPVFHSGVLYADSGDRGDNDNGGNHDNNCDSGDHGDHGDCNNGIMTTGIMTIMIMGTNSI
jgi:hypothetical protein